MIVAKYKTNKKADKSGKDDYDVVHVLVCLVVPRGFYNKFEFLSRTFL